MKILIFTILLLLTGCASFPPIASDARLYAYVRMTKGAFTGPIRGRDGYYFYIARVGKDGASLIGYHYKNDQLVDTYRSADSQTVVAALRSINIEPFDYQAEVARCDTKILAEQREGIMHSEPIVLDGAEYEIVVVTEKGRLRLQAWNPGPFLEYYSPYNEKIAGLKSVLNLLSKQCGNVAFGI